ncbi:hypothetical protein [Paenibacillus andongensis]|nr:hypothetical protein [Paenibacillus andongensis]
MKTIANHVTNILNKLQVADRHVAKKLLSTSRDLFGAEESEY